MWVVAPVSNGNRVKRLEIYMYTYTDLQHWYEYICPLFHYHYNASQSEIYILHQLYNSNTMTKVTTAS